MSEIQFKGNFHHINISPDSQLDIGQDVIFQSFASLNVASGAQLKLGNRVFFNDHCTVRCEQLIEIGKDTMFGDGVRIFDHNHQYSNYHIEKIAYSSAPVKIGANCWIGANTVILKGVTIGDNVIIGAGSLVYQDIPSNSIAVSKEELIIKKRPQGKFHAFTLTASDTLEELAYLAQELPELEFHIAAKTSISPFLESFASYPNINLYTNVHHDDIIEDLLDRADLYLDINHWGEVDHILQRALDKGKPILAFAHTAHRTGSGIYICQDGQPQQLADRIREIIKEKDSCF
ncbi:DapH/DapD/GlmU-related protein [Streptococcus panodentis]|uniref:Exopolysaccharide biosynthesis protein n=1 Tax=Streptococcus panodentis TaxID=1581472 RepID=A0ABS5AZV5_9STRE|nr:acyltransferase [Streptococcus panodentis]MBP2622112.1 exopolysaccharide biosynthesis protein [Streptococcus panodentis]